MSSGISQMDSTTSFYNSISIFGIVICMLLQITNIPFLNQYITYLEKILQILGRTYKREFEKEVENYTQYLERLKDLA